MRYRFPFGGCTVVVVLWWSAAAFAQMPVLLDRCVGCHNESGVTEDPNIPSLAGASDFYLADQLAAFAAGNRPCIVDSLEDDIDKCAVIGVLTEAQRSQLVDYFAARPYRPYVQDFDPELAKRGEPIHVQRCERCHTESGREPLDDAGLLAGQPIPYLLRQLEHFVAGRRWQPGPMASATGELERDDLLALAHFYARAGLETGD